MTNSVFRTRGVDVVVDTTKPAEFDLKGYQIADALLERWGTRLVALTFAADDVMAGDARMRELDGYAVFFTVGREPDAVVITIFRVVPAENKELVQNILRTLQAVDIFRGVTGV